MIFFSKGKKDSIYIGPINANIECRPQNLVYSNTNTLINTNYIKFDKYFVYIIASNEPFPTNSIILFDIFKNKLISPKNRILNHSDNIGNHTVFVTGPFSRIDTTNCRIETIIRLAPADLLFYSWDFKNNKSDSLLIHNKWTDISLDSLAVLNKICDEIKK